MHRPPRPSPEQEQAALEAARTLFLQFDDMSDPKRIAFTELKGATAALVNQLRPFLTDGPELSRLLYWLQTIDPVPRDQAEYAGQLVQLLPLLQSLQRACSAEVGAGRGAAPRVQRWIYTAAGVWQQQLGKKPAAGDNSSFLDALTEFRHTHPDVPEVSASQLKTALAALPK